MTADLTAAKIQIWWTIEDRSPGATVDLTGEELPDHGYYVGGASWTMVRAADKITSEDVGTYLIDQRNFRYVGVWINDGWAYLDAVTHVANHDQAVRLGRARHELAIYDISRKEAETI